MKLSTMKSTIKQSSDFNQCDDQRVHMYPQEKKRTVICMNRTRRIWMNPMITQDQCHLAVSQRTDMKSWQELVTTTEKTRQLLPMMCQVKYRATITLSSNHNNSITAYWNKTKIRLFWKRKIPKANCFLNIPAFWYIHKVQMKKIIIHQLLHNCTEH